MCKWNFREMHQTHQKCYSAKCCKISALKVDPEGAAKRAKKQQKNNWMSVEHVSVPTDLGKWRPVHGRGFSEK